MKKVKYFHGDKYIWVEKENLYVYEDVYGKFYINENGQLHREDGPAVIFSNGDKLYFINDKRHNENGPAVIWSNGNKSYYINGKRLTEKEFIQWKRNKNLKHNLEKLTKEK